MDEREFQIIAKRPVSKRRFNQSSLKPIQKRRPVGVFISPFVTVLLMF
jgi:hypothetical protein